MVVKKKKKSFFLFIFISKLFFCHLSYANIESTKKILTLNDVKIYKKIFEIQKLPIKNKNSKEWKKVDNLIKGLKNKILLGNVYADRYLHPTGWRSSYNDLKIWLDKYNDHPDATRIIRLALKRKPNNLKNPKKPTPGYLNGYGTYKANVLKDSSYLRIKAINYFGAPARGATVTLNTNMRNHSKTIDAGSGYLCQMEPVAHYGLRSGEKVNNVTIKWTDGSSDNFNIDELNKTYIFRKGI